MKTSKMKDVEQAFEEIIKEKPLIEEINISTNHDINAHKYIWRTLDKNEKRKL